MTTKRIVFIAGYCAGGKSTFARKLSTAASVVSFSKDVIKEVIGDTTGEDAFRQMQEFCKFSRITENLMRHVAERFMTVGCPLILESNFRAEEIPAYRRLLEKYGYEPLTFIFHGDLAVFHKRFHDREQTAERHFANRSEFMPLEQWERAITPLKDFDVGEKRIMVDTTDFSTVGFDGLIRTGADFLNETLTPVNN